MAFRKNLNINNLKLKITQVENVLLLRKKKMTMRKIGELVGASRTMVQNIIDSNR